MRWGVSFVALLVVVLVAPIRGQHQQPFAPLFTGDSVAGWVADSPDNDHVSASQGVLRLSDKAGWLRTDRVRFGDFRLRFDVRGNALRTQAVLAIFGQSPTDKTPGRALVLPLLSERVPDLPQRANSRFVPMAPSRSAVERVVQPAGEWQSYEVVHKGVTVSVMLNGTVILTTGVSGVLSGWLAFYAAGGDVSLRNIQLAELSASQELTGTYVRSGAGVTAPVKFKDVHPVYTPEAMRARSSGVVTLECVVLTDGTVGDVHVLRSLDAVNGLDQEAVKAAKQWLFRPATRNGEPIPTVVTVALTYTLK